MGVGSSRHAPAALAPGMRAGTHCAGGWVGPRAGLDGGRAEGISPPPEFDPQTVQPLVIPYTGWVIPTHKVDSLHSKQTYGGVELQVHSFITAALQVSKWSDTPPSLYPWGRNVRYPPQPVWKLRRGDKFAASTGNRTTIPRTFSP
jgi:hypothetical protein